MITKRYFILFMSVIICSTGSLAQSNEELAYTQQVYEDYLWKATEFYKDCCYEECIESLEFCSRMNRNRYILSPKTYERMQFVPQKGNEEQVQKKIQECKKKRIGSFTCIGKERMFLYATYQLDLKLDNISFITPWRANVKIPSQYIKDAINCAKTAKQIFHNRNRSLGNLTGHKNYREKISEHKAYYRGPNWNHWSELQAMIYYYWIDLGGTPNIEVKITTNSFEALVFYLTIEEVEKYIYLLSLIQ